MSRKLLPLIYINALSILFLLIRGTPECPSDAAVSHCNFNSFHCDSIAHHNITLLAMVPCLSLDASSRECDVFVHPAVRLAAEFINNRSSCVCRGKVCRTFGVHVNIEPLETKENMPLSVFSYITGGLVKPFHGIVGPEKSELAEIVAYISGQKKSVVSISYGAPDTLFNNRSSRFPFFHRTLPSNEAVNVGILELMRDLMWRRVAVLSSADPTHSRSAENFASAAKPFGVNLTSFGRLSIDLQAIFMEWNRTDTKIIIGMLSPADARRVLCEAYHFHDKLLLDESHAWILPLFPQSTWWMQKNSNNVTSQQDQSATCSDEIMRETLQSVLFVDTLKYHVINASTSSGDNVYSVGETVDSFIEKLKVVMDADAMNITALLRNSRAAAAFDAVVAFALAYDEVLRVDESALEHQNISGALNDTLSMIKFNGLSKFHHFSKSQDQKFSVLVTQFTGYTANPVRIISKMDEYSNTCQITLVNNKSLRLPGYSSQDYLNFTWKGKYQPSDGLEISVLFIKKGEFYGAGAILLIPFSVLIAAFISIVLYRKNRHMKAASPKFLVIVLVGFLLSLPTSIFLGLTLSKEHYGLSKKLSDALCIAEPLLHFTVPSVIAIGVYIVKNWRMYRIFHNRKNKQLKYISDPYLMLLLALLVSPFFLILIFWLSYSTPVISEMTVTVPPRFLYVYSACTTETLLERWLCSEIYYVLLLLLLLYFSVKNSRIRTQLRAHAEEGVTGTRLVIVTGVLDALISAIFTVMSSIPSTPLNAFFWAYVMSATVTLISFVGAIFVPKFVAMYWEYQRRKIHSHHSSTVRQMKQLQMEASQLQEELKEKEDRISLIRSQLNSVSSVTSM